MIRQLGIALTALVLVTLTGVGPALATDDDAPGAQLRIRGEVTAVQYQAGPDGAMQARIQVRTRTQEQLWLQLGPQAQFGDQFQVGDQVRARVRTGETQGNGQVLRIRNENTGACFQAQGDGSMVQTRTQTRTRTQASGGQGLGGPQSGPAAMNGSGSGRRGGGGGGGRGGR